jgi:hypothetical protein
VFACRCAHAASRSFWVARYQRGIFSVTRETVRFGPAISEIRVAVGGLDQDPVIYQTSPGLVIAAIFDPSAI